MYRLLIVDDEINVLEYFARVLTDKMDRALEVYTAGSAQDALDILERTRFDIILSDIKMPEMSGLELAEKIRKSWPALRIIFLSGVREFDCIYESMKNGAVRYLTKLEPTETIIKTVSEVIEEIEESYRLDSAREEAGELVRRSLPLLQNQYLQKILHGIIDPEEDRARRFEELKIQLDSNSPVILLGALFDDLPGDISSYRIDETIYSLKKISDTYLENHFSYANYISEQNHIFWLLQERSEERPPLNTLLEYIQTRGRKTMGLSVSFMYYSNPEHVNSLNEKYSTLKRRLGYRSRLLSGSILSISDTEELTARTELTEQMVNIPRLEDYLDSGNQEEFFILLDNIAGPVLDRSLEEDSELMEIYFRIAAMLLKYINNWHLRSKLMPCIDLKRLTKADSHSSWNEALEYIKSLAQYLFEIHFDDETSLLNSAVSMVQRYILENIHNDLSLIVLSDLTELNPTYLSRLYKNVCRENISDFVLRTRMEKAGELLRGSSRKVQSIAAACGYDSAPSFTRVFRKFYGQSPSDFREKN